MFSFIPSSAYFYRHRDLHSSDHVGQHFTDQLRIFQHTRTATVFRYFVDRAATVEIDSIESEVFDDFGGFASDLRFTAAQLGGDGVHGGVVVEHVERDGIVSDEGVHFDHFAEDQAWGMLRRHPAEGVVGASGKRSIEDIVG